LDVNHSDITETRGMDLERARRVLRLEADAIEELASVLDESFVRAIDALEATSGRVIVTGMGKSGHVARKIAATLASTGTPAQFVHPGEASHGDLGMITRHDVVIALSNSGETTELGDIVAHTKRIGVPLIALTRRARSTLAEQADVAITLPSSPEACSLGLAPTTSTTAMLALGDALAVALLERRGFSVEDFRDLHPGGQLGRALAKVEDVMHKGADMPLRPADSPMSEIVLEMTAKRLGCVGLTATDGRLIGVITDGDLRRNMRPDLLGVPATRVMSATPKTIRAKALIQEAIRVMNEKRITILFVVEAGRAVGVVHMHDCLNAQLV